MGNVITTILEKLKITKPSRSEKAGYFLMHDAETKEVCAVPEAAILSKINKRIDGIIYPDGFTKTTPIVRVGNTITIAPYDFAWRMVLNPYTNADEFVQIFDSTTSPELKRIDSLAVTNEGTIVYHQGVEDEFIFQAPNIPANQLWLTDVTIFGDDVQEHTEPIVTEVFTRAEKDKLAILDGTADVDKPVSTAQAAADETVLQDAKDYADTGLLLKLDAADYNDRFKGVYPTEAALNAAHPTASAGDNAQVNETGSSDVVNYSWDAEESIWVQGGSGGSGAANTDALPEGSTNLYFTTARVLATALSGLSASSGTFTSTDTFLTAFGKIKYLIDNIATTYQVIITDVNFGSFINGLTGKTTPVDADYDIIMDSADSNKLKKVSWANRKATLKDFFDTIYVTGGGISFTIMSDATTRSVTGTTAITKTHSVLVPANTLEIGDTIEFKAIYGKYAAGTSNCLKYLYINTSDTLTGATLLATMAGTGANTNFSKGRRYFFIRSSSIQALLGGTNQSKDDDATNIGLPAPVTIDRSQNLYFIIALKLITSTDEAFSENTLITLYRQ